MKFKTRYRIVTDRYSGYQVQSRPWWWPFWEEVSGNTSRSPLEAEDWFRDYLGQQARKAGKFVQDIDL
jgi:hypothetical protein